MHNSKPLKGLARGGWSVQFHCFKSDPSISNLTEMERNVAMRSSSHTHRFQKALWIWNALGIPLVRYGAISLTIVWETNSTLLSVGGISLTLVKWWLIMWLVNLVLDF